MSVGRLIVATRSSGPPASQPVIKEMPGSVASGTSYIIAELRVDAAFLVRWGRFSNTHPTTEIRCLFIYVAVSH